MQAVLSDLIVGNLFAFLLVFMRFGMAMIIMPGIGDGFVSAQIRLLFALSFSFILTPVLAHSLPPIPDQPAVFVLLMMSEAVIGIFIGTVMRILIAALDTAGMIVSIQASFSNALIFNPVTAVQGSLVGALYSMMGVTLLMMSDMHHVMLASLVESYKVYPVLQGMPEAKSLFEVISRAVSVSFLVGTQIAMPFIIVGLIIQIGFGLLSRLMPQIQIFFLAQPVQIAACLLLLASVLSVSMSFWMNGYEQLIMQLLSR
jgi:flagellar biosynthetic protein FliR